MNELKYYFKTIQYNRFTTDLKLHYSRFQTNTHEDLEE